MRQIVLDTETTGLDPRLGHRIIEIGCVEIVNRRVTDNRYHQYVQPDREIEDGAVNVHGITGKDLADKPRFKEIVGDFLDFVRGAEVIIHNAQFDVGFIDYELEVADPALGRLSQYCTVVDTLGMARKMYPGQKNSLDALCKRYCIDNSAREVHGALLDAELLADVYLAMTGGQTMLSLDAEEAAFASGPEIGQGLNSDRPRLRVIRAGVAELAEHDRRLAAIRRASDGNCVWDRVRTPDNP